jgi:competence protein ComEC
LESVRPRYVIISCGKGNSFGFPHRDTIARIRAVKAAIQRTDRDGAVEVTIGPNGLLGIRSFLGEKMDGK